MVVATLDLTDRAYVVIENVVPTLLGAVKLLEVLERIGFPAERQKLVVNRMQRIPGSLALPDIAARLNRPIDHVLPFDKQVITAANCGEPIGSRSLNFGFGGFLRPLQTLADDVDSMSMDRRDPPESQGSADAIAVDEPMTAAADDEPT